MPITYADGRELRGAQTPAELDLRAYLPLAAKYARKWAGIFGGYDEALAVASEGLVIARDRWQPHRGPFGAIVGYYVLNALYEAAAIEQRRNGVAPQDRLKANTPSRQRPRQCAQQNSVRVISANQPGDDGNVVDLFELIAADAPNPEQALIARDSATDAFRRLKLALAQLPARDRKVLRLRHAQQPAALDVVAAKLGISRERVRQLEIRALQRLRAAVAALPARLPSLPPPRARPRTRPRPVAWTRDAAGRWQATRWA